MFIMYASHYCSSNQYPSFSSTLLDSIYRSFDLGEEGMGIYRQPIDKIRIPSEEEIANFQRVCMIEKLMDKNKGVSRRKLAEPSKHGGSFGFSFSFSSSSDSSSGGGEPEEISFPGAPLRRPKPIRTGGSGHHHKEKTRDNHRLDFETNRRERRGLADHQSEPKPKHEGGFLKTKSKALKIYADLKKVKQPISPGRKLATFLNSLFAAAAGSSKKHKSDSNNPRHSPGASKSANTSTCSSASSFSRSCLSKPPSSSFNKFSSSAKRSVKFFPGSVIADEDCQPCERKASLHQETKPMNATLYSELLKNRNVKSSIDEELKVHVMEYNRRVEDAAMDFLRKTHFKNRVFDEESEEEDEDEDMESCASSDLFELDNLSTIGVERYRKELPVYETTCAADAKRV